MSLSARFRVSPLSEAAKPPTISPEEHLDELLQDYWSGDPAAIPHLRRALAGGLHFFSKRRLSTGSARDGVGDLLDSGMAALRAGEIHSGAELTGFLRIAMKAKLEEATALSRLVVPADRIQVRRMKEALAQFSQRDREAVMRFSEGQHPDLICADLGLSLAEFSTLEVRLKARFAELSGQGVRH